MPLSIEDQLDITELMARYNHAIDSSQAEAWADTFTDDAVFEGSAGAVSGREELLAFVRGRDQSNRIRHWNNNVLIDGDGDDATAKVYLVTFDVSGPPTIRVSGVYHDTLKRVDGQWKFTHRKVHSDAPPAA